MSSFEECEWYEALTLLERAALPWPEGSGEAVAVSERAVKRAERWRMEAGLTDDDLWARRLALDGLTPERFLRLLEERAEDLATRCESPLPWLRTLARALERRPSSPMPLGNASSSEYKVYLAVLEPLLDDAHDRLREGVVRLCEHRTDPPFDPGSVSELLVGELPAQMLFLVSRALTLELRIRSLEEKLPGDSPQERFQSFVESLREPETVSAILRGYPVLVRTVVQRLDQWITRSLEFLERLCADREALADVFGVGRDPGPLAELATGLSDRHRGGRTVMIATFASGLKVVYKPRPLRGEQRFQELLAWLDERGASPPSRTLKMLDRGEYGWVEHVARGDCASREELKRFYERQGGYLALLYALSATDVHSENLIAAGEHPVLIDLETLFQPLQIDLEGSGPDAHIKSPTVLRSCLLPQRFSDRQPDLDLSALGASRDQRAEMHGVADAGTDRMRHVLSPAEVVSGDHQPAPEDETIRLWEMDAVIVRGFRAMYRLLEHHRGELLAVEGPLERFADTEMRVILRGTDLYARLLLSSYHPDLLPSALLRDRLFDKLWLSVEQRPDLWRVVRAEIEDLAVGDVPRFTSRPSSADLYTSSGERVEDFFPHSGMELVRRRFAQLGERDLERQSWIVKMSLEATRPITGKGRPRLPLPETGEPATREHLLSAARDLGRRLETLAVHQGEQVGWFRLGVDTERRAWQLEPAGLDLYDGLPGIVLFLAQLGVQTGEGRWTELARTAWETVRRSMEQFPAAFPRIGAYTGWGGLVYASTFLGLLWDESSFLEEAAGYVPELVSRIEEDEDFDVIAGAAGALAALLALERQLPPEGDDGEMASSATLEAAVACGEHLLVGARRTERGLGWPARGNGDPPLTGFSHGTAGVAWALAGLAARTGDERFAAAAHDALVYERSWFRPEAGTWQDVREDHRNADGGHEFVYAWCHGAPGIGLGRVGLSSHVDDPMIEDEIRTAVGVTLEHGFGESHCLCHGDLGNLDLVLKAGEVLDDPELRTEAGRFAGRILAGWKQTGWRCGTGVDLEIPGLMTGIAGIGYGLLRAAVPDAVPSVLLLETPSAVVRGAREGG